jgi:phosphatidylglycerophosphate synthase
MSVVITSGMVRSGMTRLGPADNVTLTRASLVVGVAALTVDSLSHPAPVAVLVGLTAVALALDGVDGQVARRTGTVSAFGARFDMEVDSFLLLILSLYAARAFGPWVLAIGGMRYAFVAAMWLRPWMRRTLPPRYWRKVVAATQGVTLVAATAGVLARPVMVLALLAALALLLESFGRDVGWLWLRRVPAHAHAHRAAPARRGTRPAPAHPDGWPLPAHHRVGRDARRVPAVRHRVDVARSGQPG